MINRDSYKSLLESVQEAVAPIEESDSLWLSRNKQNAKKAAKPMAEEDEWDEIDEILAEGIDMYGEDGLVEILADFAETGELSEELVDILEATGFDPMELARRLNNNTHAEYLAQFNAPSASVAKQTGMASRPERQRKILFLSCWKERGAPSAESQKECACEGRNVSDLSCSEDPSD